MVKVDRLRSQLRRHMPAGFLLLGVLIGALLVIAFGSGDTTSTPSATSSSAGNSSSGGMNMGTGATSGASAGGIKPVPMQQLGVADWQGMKITADAMTPVPFIVYNGTTSQEIKPAKNTSCVFSSNINSIRHDCNSLGAFAQFGPRLVGRDGG